MTRRVLISSLIGGAALVLSSCTARAVTVRDAAPYDACSGAALALVADGDYGGALDGACFGDEDDPRVNALLAVADDYRAGVATLSDPRIGAVLADSAGRREHREVVAERDARAREARSEDLESSAARARENGKGIR